MIDWLTIKTDISNLSPEDRKTLQGHCSTLMKIDPSGEIVWSTGQFESLRSDMCGLAWNYGTHLTLAGSPASIIHTNNVFGTSDIAWAFRYMVEFFELFMKVSLPSIENWSCSRIDFTQNYDVGGQPAVAQTLQYLRQCPTRGNNVERKHSTVYWNKTSTMRSAKAYNKYEHAKAHTKKNRAYYTPEQYELVKNIIRLELKLGRHWIRKLDKPWYSLTQAELQNQHNDFFSEVLGDIEVPTMDTLLSKLLKVAPTKGQAMSAFNYFALIRQVGSENARAVTSETTHYRHVSNLKKAGLTKADLQSGQILAFRPQLITMKPVDNWNQIQQVA
jgi:II/X family phage/plasmid replication protein